MAKAAEAIVSGAILGLKLQPYEAHIPYLLQFKLDWNLYGMGHIVMRAVRFRRDPKPASQPLRSPPTTWKHVLTPIIPVSASPLASKSGSADSEVRPGLLPQITQSVTHLSSRSNLRGSWAKPHRLVGARY